MLSVSMLPPPNTCDLPDFPRWRPTQVEALERALASDRRVIGIQAPTGVGKTLIALGLCQLQSDLNATILTSTKGLQDQYHATAPHLLTDVRGQGNYACLAARDTFAAKFAGRRIVGCDEGPCRVGEWCELKPSLKPDDGRSGGCLYYEQLATARRARMVVTSYDYWMSIHRFGDGLGARQLLILDEAHDAAEKLADHLKVEVHSHDTLEHFPRPMTTQSWRSWAARHLPSFQRAIESGTLRTRLHAKQLLASFTQIAHLPADWIWELSKQGVRVTFSPVLVDTFAERHIFHHVDTVVLMSATLTTKTMADLGVTEFEWITLPSPFAKTRRPVYLLRDEQRPVRVDFRISDEAIAWWIQRIDAIIAARLDRKGIIHTVSYKRQQLILARSDHASLMIAPKNAAALRSAIDQFKHASAPAILLSPSVVTGFDFPYRDAEYQVLSKIPFPDTRPAIVQARKQADPGYADHLTMQTTVQAVGRAMRAEDDQCETFVVDEHSLWFLHQHRALAPRWFLDAISVIKAWPEVPQRLSA